MTSVITPENIKITFFRVDRCGYYTNGPKSHFAFGDITEILTSLSVWGKGKQLFQTQTFQSPAKSAQLPVFLYKISEFDDEWILVLWNQVPATDNKVASVQSTGIVGNAAVHMNNVATGTIPGFATYFWFIPSKNVFANIRFQHPTIAHHSLRTYLKSFIERHSIFTVYKNNPQTADVELLGYRHSHSSPIQHLSPRFYSEPFRKPGQTDMLRINAKHITKIIRKTTLDMLDQEDLAFWQEAWRKIQGKEKSSPTQPVSMVYEIPTESLSSDEINDIISNAEHDSSSWDDVGFMLKGDPNPHWLSKSFARDTFLMNVKRENQEILDLDHLHKELKSRQKQILSLLD